MPADEDTVVLRDTFGEVGLLDMPSAHMASDGSLSFTVGDVGPSQRYNFTFQRKTWMEGVFRYSKLTQAHGDYDRSASVKIRLVRDVGDWWPDISVGVRNLLGTGQYDAEYVVASKRIGDIDFTAGLGFGRLSGGNQITNPFGLALSSFKTRSANSGGLGGNFRVTEFFHGKNAGAFGGIAWQTPVNGLSLVLEASSDKYIYESLVPGGMKARSPLNVGLSYQPSNLFSVSGGWMYGTTYGFTITVAGDASKTYPNALRLGPEVPRPAIRTGSQQQSALRVLQDGRRSGLSSTASNREERQVQDLRQALHSEIPGIRNVEVDGKSLLVDARGSNNRNLQCAQYARIASPLATGLTTIAVSDLQDPAGEVTFCRIGDNARVARSDWYDSVNLLASPSDAIRPKLTADLDAQGLLFDAVKASQSELWLYYENYKYLNESDAIGRIIRVLMLDAPPNVEIFHIVAVKFGVPQHEVTVTRSGMERALDSHTPYTALSDAVSLRPAPFPDEDITRQMSHLYPSFSWAFDPKLTQHLFDPDLPLQLMVYGDLTALLQLAPGLNLQAELTGTIWSNYTFDRGAGSDLPHVRTDLLQYLKHGKYGIANLTLGYRSRVSPTVFTEFRAGLIEDMFAGAGGQILWRPEGSRLSYGADIYQVWQREYHRLFGIKHYNVLTGHVSVYYETPWNGINVAFHAGRYLAGDYGGTIQVTRRLDTGVEIGAWATFTNVPFAKFGEGSFDKGIIIHIPFEWGLPIHSQAAYDLHMSSLTRDGGQRLGGDDSLFEATRGASYGEISQHMEDLIEP